jgi:HSP20 family protein
VSVEVTEDAIVISGERKDEREVERGGVHVTERRYGQFYRSIPLPEGAQTDQVKARFENGVLEITVPAQETRTGRRQIQVEGAGSGAVSGSGGSEKRT